MDGMAAFWIVLPLALVASTVVHECGHWAMAALLRCHPQVVCFGSGRQVWQIRALGVHLVLRAAPLGGYVLLLPMGCARRDAHAAVTAAGPGANALAMLAASLLWLGGAVPGPAVLAIVGTQAVALIGTLLPAVEAAAGRLEPSDGAMLLAWARGHDEDMLERAYAPIVARLPPDRRPAMTADFPEALFHAIRCDRDEPWGRAQAMAGLRSVLARGRLNPYEHLASQKRLQRDLEEQQQALAATANREAPMS